MDTRHYSCVVIIGLLCLVGIISAAPRPVVLWHGMGDNCCNPQSMGFLKSLIEKHIPNVYVYSVMVGDSPSDDTTAGFFGDMNEELRQVCNKIAKDPKLAQGFNAIGFSQGGQFLRAYVERCNSPPVHNLISIGGQHQGVYGLPHCPGVNVTLCNYIRELLDYGAYISWVQELSIQAQYWHDPFASGDYVKYSLFLGDINNVRQQKNETYKQNLIRLNKFVMVKFTEDTMVQPIASEWFGEYLDGQDQVTVPLNRTRLYLEDWIGMRVLDEKGKLDFLSVVGDHLQFTQQWFIQNIIQGYLTNNVTASV